MTIELTATGFTNVLGQTASWSTFTDFVYGSVNGFGETAVLVANGVTAATLAGNDVIAGNAQGINGIGLEVEGTLQTNEGSDLVTGSALSGSAGISISGTLGTGQGSDKVIGQGLINGIEIGLGATLTTKDGSDVVVGVGGFIGILNQGTIEMDISGQNEAIDVIQAAGQIGLANTGEIRFAAGNDSLTAISADRSNVDLLNTGTIRMGVGADTLLLGGSNLMSGGGEIYLGDGGDTFGGFGDMTVFAGNGVNDTLILPAEFTGSPFPVSYTVGINGDEVTFTTGGITMVTTGFETLEYGGFIDDPAYTFNFSDLENGQVITFVG